MLHAKARVLTVQHDSDPASALASGCVTPGTTDTISRLDQVGITNEHGAVHDHSTQNMPAEGFAWQSIRELVHTDPITQVTHIRSWRKLPAARHPSSPSTPQTNRGSATLAELANNGDSLVDLYLYMHAKVGADSTWGPLTRREGKRGTIRQVLVVSW